MKKNTLIFLFVLITLLYTAAAITNGLISFSNGNYNETFTYSTGGGNVTRYLDIPMYNYVTELKINITGLPYNGS